MLIERIQGFVGDESLGDFGSLALEAFSFQYSRIGAYGEMCDRLGWTPETVEDWRQIPLIPTRAFKSMELATDAAGEVFRSSGTTGSERSVHRHPYPDLYRATIDATFPALCLPPPGDRVPMLSLIPDRDELPDSSLSFMIDHAVRSWGDAASAWAIGRRGVDSRALRSWLAARQRDGRASLILATAFALAEAVENLQRLGLRFRLPPGSVVFETGGYKGRRSELEPAEVERAVGDQMGVPAERIVREYGMTELTSQLYSAVLAGGANDAYQAPHWVRVRCLDPETLDEAAPGEIGLVTILDLANVGSALHLLTEDLGVLGPDGLRLRGRAGGAELRGCSLTAEALSRQR